MTAVHETRPVWSARQLLNRASLLRGASMLALTGLCLFLLRDRLSSLDAGAIVEAIMALSPFTVAAALILGCISHAGLAGYDVLAFRRIGRQVPLGRALKGGFAGTVFAQVLGCGLLTGSLARWRIYRANAISPTEAIALSGFVSAGFFSGLFVLLVGLTVLDPSIAAQVTGLSPGMVRLVAAAALVTIAGLCALANTREIVIQLHGTRLSVPDGAWLAGAVVLAAIDLVPAALCLLVLLPDAGVPGLGAFVAIYIAAVALGHLIGSPGAVGPFEGIIFLSLPGLAISELAAAVLVYRLVYYLPAFVAALGLVLTARSVPGSRQIDPGLLADRVHWTLEEGGQAEGELALLGDKRIFLPPDLAAFVMYQLSGRIWLVMGDPIGPTSEWPALIDAFERRAKAVGATIAIYKATHASMPFWSERGWHLQALGCDAILNVADFSLDGPKRRELRRKLKNVQKVGITLRIHWPGRMPLQRLASVADAWKLSKDGREQTYSMGHWSPDFVARHLVIEADRAGTCVAFVSIWISGDGREWMLDLMRQTDEAPNGTMQALIVKAVQAAQASRVEHLNLCMAPLTGLSEPTSSTLISHVLSMIYERGDHRHGLKGLKRFKDTFRPEWQPRYMVVRRRWHLPEALIAAHALVSIRKDRETDIRASPAVQPRSLAKAVRNTIPLRNRAA